jgi:hypothetical protein
MEIVAEPSVVEELRRRGGVVYVWPRKRRCCGGTIVLEAATSPTEQEFRLVVDTPVRVFAIAGMAVPDTLHLEIDRRSRVRAYWDGLGWVA